MNSNKNLLELFKDKNTRELFIKEVIFLGIHKIDNVYSIYAAIMPYFNEIVNLISITFTYPVLGIKLYYHYAVNFKQIIVNSIVTLFSITGIIANSVNIANIYSRNKGLIAGTMFTIFSFLIPNIFMYNFLKMFKNNTIKFIVGIIIIYILDIIIHFIIFLYKIYILDPEKIQEEEEKRKRNRKFT